MRTRTPEQNQALFTWLKPSEVAPLIGVDTEDDVKFFIRNGSLEGIDVSRGNQVPQFRVSPASVERYLEKRGKAPPIWPPAVPSVASVVYLIATKEGPARFKVGWASNAEGRFAHIQAMSPVALALVHVVPGGPALERRIHRAIDDYRLHGEWFIGEAEPEAKRLMELWKK